MSVDVFLDRLDKVKTNGSGWVALCPVHDDHDPSLSIKKTDDGATMIYCQVCHADGKVVAEELGIPIRELFGQTNSPRSSSSTFLQLEDADRTHPYRDEAGKLLYTVAVFTSGTSKQVRPFLPSGKQGYGPHKILYRLDELVNSAGTVYVVEGEKDADRLVSLGLTATTSPMGAGNFKSCDSSALNGCHVVVVGDNDDPGRKHVQDVVRQLQSRAASMRVIELPDLPPKGDISDWFDSGHTVDELNSLAESSTDTRSLKPDEPNGTELRFTDVDNSRRLIQLQGDKLRYVTEWGTWIVWEGTRWLIDRNRVAVFELAKSVSSDLYRQAAANPDAARQIGNWAKQSATRSRISSMVELARGIDGVAISHDDLDTDPWLLGVANGYIDLRTGAFHEPDPDKLMTMQTPVAYDPDACAPRWEKALGEWFPDPEVLQYVQRLSGHALSGDSLGEHIFAIHYGNGRNGKGTFMRAHKHILGPYYVTPDKSLLVQRRHEQHATVKARLFRARLAVASETEQRERLNEAQVKNLTGGDPINARRMREDEWEFDPTHSLWLQTNYPPEIHGIDSGIWSRIKIVPWTVTFESQVDPQLDASLASESAGILNWAIEGCLEWQRNGLDEPEAVVRATLEYRATEDVLSRFATDTGLVFKRGQVVVDAELKRRIAEWAADEGVDPPGAKKINAWMKVNGCTEGRENYVKSDDRTSKRKVWKNAYLSGPGEEPSETPETQGTTGETTLPGRSGTTLPVPALYSTHIGVNRNSGSSASSRPQRDNESLGRPTETTSRSTDSGADPDKTASSGALGEESPSTGPAGPTLPASTQDNDRTESVTKGPVSASSEETYW